MKPYYRLILAISLIVIQACTSQNKELAMLEQTELLLDADSVEQATALFQRIDTTNIKDEDIFMYYSLTKTIITFRNYEEIKTDSVISRCADYYKMRGDKTKYATAKHYQSFIQYELGKIEDAVRNEKIAEDIAEQLQNYKLLNKISTLLTIVNVQTHNYDAAFVYAHKQMATATKIESYKWKVYAYLYLAILHNECNNIDSASFYIDKCLSLTKYLDYIDNSFVYSNLGEICLDADTTTAEKYFLKALSYRKLPETYANLCNIYYKNNSRKASQYKDSALAYALSHQMKIDILRNIAHNEEIVHNYNAATECLEQIIQLQDSLLHQKKDSEIQELQNKYDFEKQDNTFHKRINIFMTIIVTLLLILTVIYLKWKAKIDRITSDKNRIENQKMQIEAHNAKLAQEKAESEARNAKLLQEKAEVERQNALTEAQNAKLQQEKAEVESKRKEDEIRNSYIKTNLFSTLQNTIDCYAAQLQDGSISEERRKIFTERKAAAEKELSAALTICKNIENHIKDNQPDPKCPREYFDLFVGYYETIHPECKSFFTIYYKNLVTSDKLFLILEHFERKDKDQICSILIWGEGTYRSRRSKVKSKQVIEPPQD